MDEIYLNDVEKPKQQGNTPPPKTDKPLVIATLGDLLTHRFPEREPVLSPVFCLASLNMIFSARGVGKTHAALGIAYAAASGSSFWAWTANRPIRTLYIDGEMPGQTLQERLAEIVSANDKEPPDGFFNIIPIDLNDGYMPDLSTLNGQIAIENHCLAAELIIVDNLSCLCRSGRENEAESWLSIAGWAMKMRSLGKCIIFIHHAGKDGNQRGTSKREDILDVVIELKRPGDYREEQGARFVVQYTKARHLTGVDAKPFEAMLQKISGKQEWTTRTIEDSTYDQVIELNGLGLSVTDMANELGINKSNVSRALKKAAEDGKIKPKSNVFPIKKQGKTSPRRKDIDDE